MDISKTATTEIVEQELDSLSPETKADKHALIKHKIRKCRNCDSAVKSDNALCPHCGANLKRKPRSLLRKKLKEFFVYCDRLLDRNVNISRKNEDEDEKKKIKYRW